MRRIDAYPMVTGVVVGFLLGTILAVLALSRWGRSRKVLRWDSAQQWRVIPRQLSDMAALAVVLRIGERDIKALSLVSVQLTVQGNTSLESVTAVIATNREAEVLGVRILEGGNIAVGVDGHECRLAMSKLSPRDSVLIEMLVRDYEEGTLDLKLSDSDIMVHRRWTLALHAPPGLRSVGLSVPGVRYDPAARAMITVAEELQGIRSLLARLLVNVQTRN